MPRSVTSTTACALNMLPHGNRAVIEIEKLRDYCLSPEHPRGRHKARVFVSALGLTAADAEALRTHLLNAAAQLEARATIADSLGQRFVFFHAASKPVRHDPKLLDRAFRRGLPALDQLPCPMKWHPT